MEQLKGDGFAHRPVLLEETLTSLVTTENGIYVDGTLGGGGHAEALLRACPAAQLIGIDRDHEALDASKQRLAPFGDRAVFVWDDFRNIDAILDDLGVDAVDGVLLDLGVSSPQLDHAERGFSYQQEAPLDMRMDRERQTLTAADIVNGYTEAELTRLLYDNAEERWAKRIAAFIVAERQKRPLVTTADLTRIVKAAIPKGARDGGHHPAKRTFQALRIAVNDELDIIAPTLTAAADRLKTGGRLAVISFHSLEDRIVKDTFKYLAADCVCRPEQVVCTCNKRKTVKILTRRPIVGGEAELAENPRARSAKLRVAEKVE